MDKFSFIYTYIESMGAWQEGSIVKQITVYTKVLNCIILDVFQKKKKKIHYVTLHSVCIHYVRYFHHDK